MYKKQYFFDVKQTHIGENGDEFEAWTLMKTSDPIRAVLEANESKYRGRPLGKVTAVKLLTW